MTHLLRIKGTEIHVSVGCYHPELEHNICPTGDGDCAECPFCKATIEGCEVGTLWHLQDGYDE